MAIQTPFKERPATTTREDVARRARVSVGTVSMGLRGDPRIKKETAKLVQMVAHEMNYRPRASASALAGGRTHMVGFVFAAHPQFEERILIRAYSLLLERVGEILSSRNYHLNLVVQSLVRDKQGGHKLPRMFHESGIEGFLVVHAPNALLAKALESQGVPYVLLDVEPTDARIAVYVDECRAAELAVEHLIELGHRRIANLSTLSQRDHDQVSHRGVQFPRGYLRAMTQAGLPAMPGWDEPLSLVDQHLQGLWAQPQHPTALVTYDDQTAGQVIKWLYQRGLKVPGDVSVAALHDTGDAATDCLMPPITCNGNKQEQMGSVAVKKLLNLIEHPEQRAESTCLQPELVVRQSTGPVSPSAT